MLIDSIFHSILYIYIYVCMRISIAFTILSKKIFLRSIFSGSSFHVLITKVKAKISWRIYFFFHFRITTLIFYNNPILQTNKVLFSIKNIYQFIYLFYFFYSKLFNNKQKRILSYTKSVIGINKSSHMSFM